MFYWDSDVSPSLWEKENEGVLKGLPERGEETMRDPCSSVSKLLERYSDKEVTAQERSFVEDHLSVCETCRNELRLMERLRDLVKTPVEEAMKKEEFPWVWQKIKRGIQSEEKPTWWEAIRSWLDITPFSHRKVWIPAVAVIAILVVTTAPLLFKKSPSYPSPSVVEYVESKTHNVMVYELEKTKVTVIWLFEEPEKEIPSS